MSYVPFLAQCQQSQDTAASFAQKGMSAKIMLQETLGLV